MALPVMALFLRKVYNDPQFGIMEADEFERPANFNMELDCEKVKKGNSRGDNSRRVTVLRLGAEGRGQGARGKNYSPCSLLPAPCSLPPAPCLLPHALS